MKILSKITMISATLFALSVSAQTVRYTSYEVSENGKFYEVREILYADGSGRTIKELLGDTLTVFEKSMNEFVTEGIRMANDAREVSKFDKIITKIADRNAVVLAATGRDILDTLTARYAVPLLAQGWAITNDTGTVDISFNVNSQGQLRYQVSGFQTRNAFVVANTLRLLNYAGTDKPLDLFKSPGGNWFSVDDRVKLKFPGNAQSNREALRKAGVNALVPSEERILALPVEAEQPAKKTAKKKKQ